MSAEAAVRWLTSQREISNLTVRQVGILLRLQAFQVPEDRTMRALGRGLGISFPSVSRSVDRLFELGLVVRSEDPDDRRKCLVGLTREGGVLVEKFLKMVKAP